MCLTTQTVYVPRNSPASVALTETSRELVIMEARFRTFLEHNAAGTCYLHTELYTMMLPIIDNNDLARMSAPLTSLSVSTQDLQHSLNLDPPLNIYTPAIKAL